MNTSKLRRIVTACLVAMTASAVTSGGCRRLLCSEKVRSEVRSQDGKRLVVVSQTNCGATTSIATFVTIQDKEAWFGGASEILALGSFQDELPVRWVDARVLEVSLSKEAASEILRQQLRSNDVTVNYVYASGKAP